GAWSKNISQGLGAAAVRLLAFFRSFPRAAMRLILRTGSLATRAIKLWFLPLLAILLVRACVVQLRSKVVEVSGFEVSPDMAAAGYTSNTLSRLFAQSLQDYKDDVAQFRLSEQDRKRTTYAVANSELDIKVPETEISLETLVRYVRDALHNPVTRISGSCVT